MSQRLEDLQNRCERAGYRVDDLGGQLRIIEPRLEEREDYYGYEIFVDEGLHAELALRSEFQYYRQTDKYPAIWSQELGAIECRLRSSEDENSVSPIPKKKLLQIVLMALGKDPKDLSPENRVEIPIVQEVDITIGPCSEAFAFHFEAFEYNDDYKVIRVENELTFRIEGVELESEDQVGEVLMKLGNGALFELDRYLHLGLSIPFFPMRHDEDVEQLRDLLKSLESGGAIQLPSEHKEYDPKPLSLYWYGRSVSEMPLVRFLAYYQVLEYYFPIYSRSKAITTLREKLKEIFGRVKDSDVADVVDAMRVNRRAMLGGEKDQLTHTIERCVDPVELSSFLEDNEERSGRFYESDEALKISTINIPIGGSSYDPRSEVALRVYEIRNRIVHTKSQHDDLQHFSATLTH